MFLLVLAVVSAGVFASGCVFGPTSYKGVIGYRKGRVFVHHDSTYSVGILPEGWERMKTRVRAISFYNDALRSSISTDAFCGRGISDRKIDALGGEVVSGLENRVMLSEVPFELDNRGALRQRLRGSLDGADVLLDLVVVRKDGCVFDFYAVTPAAGDPQVTSDFEAFYGAFHYE